MKYTKLYGELVYLLNSIYLPTQYYVVIVVMLYDFDKLFVGLSIRRLSVFLLKKNRAIGSLGTRLLFSTTTINSIVRHCPAKILSDYGGFTVFVSVV